VLAWSIGLGGVAHPGPRKAERFSNFALADIDGRTPGPKDFRPFSKG
jgi:hypothetical protein